MVYIQYMTNTNRIQSLKAPLKTTLQATRVTTPQGGHVMVSTMGGQYHGPSNVAGLTAREYWDAWAEEQDERNDW